MNKIITISREFGSGGRELGKRLAQSLGIAYYDREIVAAIAQQSGLAEKYVESISERGMTTYYPITIGRTFSLRPVTSKAQMDVLVEQRKILKDLAEKSDCIIVGRRADIVLQEHKPLNLFIYADMDSKLHRCLNHPKPKEHLNSAELKKQIVQVDRGRTKYRDLLTGTRWGDKSAYHLCVNTTGFAIKALLPTIQQFQSAYFEGGQ